MVNTCTAHCTKKTKQMKKTTMINISSLIAKFQEIVNKNTWFVQIRQAENTIEQKQTRKYSYSLRYRVDEAQYNAPKQTY